MLNVRLQHSNLNLVETLMPEKTTTNDHPIYTTHSFYNFGPIALAEKIKTAPLTVFVGPSNSGKTMLATAIYSQRLAFRTAIRGLMLNSKKFQRKRDEKELISTLVSLVSESTVAELSRCFGVRDVSPLILQPRKKTNTRLGFEHL